MVTRLGIEPRTY